MKNNIVVTVDPTNYFNSLGWDMSVVKVATGYVPGFITLPVNMIDQLRLSHSVVDAVDYTYDVMRMQLKCDKTDRISMPLACVKSDFEMVVVYSQHLVHLVKDGGYKIFAYAPFAETMKLSVENA